MHEDPIRFDPMLEYLRQSMPMTVETFELYQSGASCQTIAKEQAVNWRTVLARVEYVRRWLDAALSGEEVHDG